MVDSTAQHRAWLVNNTHLGCVISGSKLGRNVMLLRFSMMPRHKRCDNALHTPTISPQISNLKIALILDILLPTG